MATFVSSEWVSNRLAVPDVLLLDPRSPMRYLQGHLATAVNVPVGKLFDAQGWLRAVEDLAPLLGQAGLGADETPVLYDGHDGRNAAMLAWVLEYLGRTDVHILDIFFERWVEEGREIFYRPVKATAKPESTEGGRRVSVLKRQEGAPVLLG